MAAAVCALAVLVGGCGKAQQGPACRAFVSCVQQFDARNAVATDVARFMPEGGCWDSDKLADLCEKSCERGLPRLKAQDPGLECMP